MTRRVVIIGGTEYAGEMKKSVFSLLNYLLPLQGVMPMHCSANIGRAGDVALFFGLSGTGKTTLSADPQRRLIGDDEHGWSDSGVFNFEGGCYAKCIHLSAKTEPQIWAAIRFGTVLENVVANDGRHCDFDDESLIFKNTRAAYPVDFIPGCVIPGVGGHASNVVFLTADAFGVLPPVSSDAPSRPCTTSYRDTRPRWRARRPASASRRQLFPPALARRFCRCSRRFTPICWGRSGCRNKSRVWLLNTGWSGGGFGVGQRIKLPYTRAMVTAALSGEVDGVATRPDPLFGVEIPVECPGVPAEILDPGKTWAKPREFEATARDLAGRFHKNFQQFTKAGAEIREAGPRVEVAV